MVAIPPTLMAGRRLLRALRCAADLLIVCRRQLILYLPVGVPKWRLFCTRSAALFGCSVPSGVVPGDGDLLAVTGGGDAMVVTQDRIAFPIFVVGSCLLNYRPWL